MRPIIPLLPLALIVAACGGPAETTPVATSDFDVKLTPVVTEAEWPWGLAFLPNGDLLFTEKEGGLKFVAGGEGTPSSVTGLPEAFIEGQAGYLGLVLDPDFETNRMVYISYSKGDGAANAAAVIKGRLSDDASALENVEEIFWADARDTAYHYGSRLQFANDGTLFVSLGEGFSFMKDAQDPTNTHGTIVRINTDGSIPADNPFADGEAGAPAVWSYGHRNVQGLYYDTATDTLYETEHGPKGGDELNISTPGANYGWPKITYGVNYDGTIITNETEAEGMVQPLTYWVPSIAPSGLTMLTSDVYPGWKGDLFTGGMNGPAGLELTRIDMENGEVVGKQSLFDEEYAIRDVVQGPDGHLYVATKDFDGIFRVDIAEAEAE
ncbi:PQQ-dependent sugar dehydrogenase [Hyphomonas sp.]|jgi:glucose/arabinose dehydrogenase|uniref:PQQ-dependent sugar dehydrogenase n=1 Tax=Hyphomonas sp. TaxID=87 RepID=UPI0025C2BF5C|nr:PQQ-dependent sugar dehydrogenase [Hyphomonas sp.]MDF1807664.1 PQQ-dependent sugar dehydrogenase [Hyphomonas sp.]